MTGLSGDLGRPTSARPSRPVPPAPPLSPADRAVRLAVYRTFADQGRPPSVTELAAQTGLPGAEVRAALGHLHQAHAIVLTPAGDAVRMAHPFSAAPMGFVVAAEGLGPAGYAGDRMWWGGCAWDSLGIGAALGEPVAVRTLCPGCGRTLRATAGPRPGTGATSLGPAGRRTTPGPAAT